MKRCIEPRQSQHYESTFLALYGQPRGLHIDSTHNSRGQLHVQSTVAPTEPPGIDGYGHLAGQTRKCAQHMLRRCRIRRYVRRELNPDPHTVTDECEGGPTAAVIAFNNPNIRVTVVDLNETRIRRWNSRHPPIYEPGLEDIVRVARDGTRETLVANEPGASSSNPDAETLPDAPRAGCGSSSRRTTTVPARQPNLFFSTDVGRCISEADIVLVAVNTPTKTRGAGNGCATDMTAFEAVTADVARHAKPGAIIVEKSTVPCRTAQMVQETVCSLYLGRQSHER